MSSEREGGSALQKMLLVATVALVVGTSVLGVLLLTDVIAGRGYPTLLTSLAVLAVVTFIMASRLRRPS